jgi:hypothetical protein
MKTMKYFRNLTVGAMLLLTVTMQFFAANAYASCANNSPDRYCREHWSGSMQCYFEGSSTDGCCTAPVEEEYKIFSL